MEQNFYNYIFRESGRQKENTMSATNTLLYIRDRLIKNVSTL